MKMKIMIMRQVIAVGLDSDGIPRLLPFNIHCGEATPGVEGGIYELAAEAAKKMDLESVVMFTREDPVPDGFFEMFDWKNAACLFSPSSMN